MVINSVMAHGLRAADARSAAMSASMMSSLILHGPFPCDGRTNRFKTSSTNYDHVSNTSPPDPKWSPWRFIEESALPLTLWTLSNSSEVVTFYCNNVPRSNLEKARHRLLVWRAWS